MGKLVAVNLRLDTEDFELLRQLALKLRTGQAGVVTLGLRHLGESIRRGQPIYVARVKIGAGGEAALHSDHDEDLANPSGEREESGP